MLTIQLGRASRAIAYAAAIALVLNAAAAPASAAYREDPSSERKGSGTQSESKVPTKRYCIIGPTTGTFFPKKICKTREQWIREDGWDPAAERK